MDCCSTDLYVSEWGKAFSQIVGTYRTCFWPPLTGLTPLRCSLQLAQPKKLGDNVSVAISSSTILFPHDHVENSPQWESLWSKPRVATGRIDCLPRCTNSSIIGVTEIHPAHNLHTAQHLLMLQKSEVMCVVRERLCLQVAREHLNCQCLWHIVHEFGEKLFWRWVSLWICNCENEEGEQPPISSSPTQMGAWDWRSWYITNTDNK